MGFWEGLKRGTRAFGKALAEGPEPFPYAAGDVQVICPHCGYDRFHEGHALQNTRGMTFAGFDWLDGSATFLACHHCGLIQWFAKKPRRVEAGPKSVQDDALD
mgnify:CR=1 FL=1